MGSSGLTLRVGALFLWWVSVGESGQVLWWVSMGFSMDLQVLGCNWK